MRQKKSEKRKKKQKDVICGLRIRPHENEHSTFQKYFSFLLPEVHTYKWLVDWEAFNFPWHDWDEAKEEEIESRRKLIDQYYLIDTYFLIEYIDYVNNFWNSVYGFSNPQTDWEEWIKLRFSAIPQEQLEYVIESTDIAFYCIDGAYWEVYTKHEDIIHRLFEKYSNTEPIKSPKGF